MACAFSLVGKGGQAVRRELVKRILFIVFIHFSLPDYFLTTVITNILL
jgi:hypothetical protein